MKNEEVNIKYRIHIPKALKNLISIRLQKLILSQNNWRITEEQKACTNFYTHSTKPVEKLGMCRLGYALLVQTSSQLKCLRS